MLLTDPLGVSDAVLGKQDEIVALLAETGDQSKFKRNLILKEIILLFSK